MKEFRVMIAGSRGFNDYDLLESVVKMSLLKRKISNKKYNIIIVSGRAKGADALGEAFAKEYGYNVEYYPADWDNLDAVPCSIKYNKYGNPYNCLAGMNRNKTMVELSDLIIMFHDGNSKGTQNDLDLCKRMDKDYEYINYSNYTHRKTSFYTGYYSGIKNYPIDALFVSIALKTPVWYDGMFCDRLSPSKQILERYKYEVDGFEDCFQNEENYELMFQQEILGKLHFETVMNTFKELANGRDVIFLCYETPDNFCHRHLVSKWFRNNGVKCEEYKIKKILK